MKKLKADFDAHRSHFEDMEEKYKVDVKGIKDGPSPLGTLRKLIPDIRESSRRQQGPFQWGTDIVVRHWYPDQFDDFLEEVK